MTLELVDTHAHLDFEQFQGEEAETLERAQQAGVTRLINVGTSLEHSEASVQLAERFGNVRAAVGVHPYDIGELVSEECERNQGALKRLEKLAYHERTVAIGEIGFDFHRTDTPPTEQQSEAFFAQAEVAEAAGLPIIVHFRGNEGEGRDDDSIGLGCLREYADNLVANNPLRRWPGVVHSYTGSLDDAQALLESGYYISFTAPVTYPKNDALREVVKAVPLDRVMVETDSPFLPPPGKRGKRNEPAYVVETAQKIAEVKGISLESLAEATTENAERLFGLS